MQSAFYFKIFTHLCVIKLILPGMYTRINRIIQINIYILLLDNSVSCWRQTNFFFYFINFRKSENIVYNIPKPFKNEKIFIELFIMFRIIISYVIIIKSFFWVITISQPHIYNGYFNRDARTLIGYFGNAVKVLSAKVLWTLQYCMENHNE